MDGTPSKSTEMLFGVSAGPGMQRERRQAQGWRLAFGGTWTCPQPRGRVDAGAEGQGRLQGQPCGRCRANDFYV